MYELWLIFMKIINVYLSLCYVTHMIWIISLYSLRVSIGCMDTQGQLI